MPNTLHVPPCGNQSVSETRTRAPPRTSRRRRAYDQHSSAMQCTCCLTHLKRENQVHRSQKVQGPEIKTIVFRITYGYLRYLWAKGCARLQRWARFIPKLGVRPCYIRDMVLDVCPSASQVTLGFSETWAWTTSRGNRWNCGGSYSPVTAWLKRPGHCHSVQTEIHGIGPAES